MGKNNKSHLKAKNAQSAGPPDTAAFKAAEQAHKKGERRHGNEAIPYLQAAVQHYQTCISQTSSKQTRIDAQVLCSSALQYWAKELLYAHEVLPDAEQTYDGEQKSKREAFGLYQQAVQVVESSKSESGSWTRADAAMNCGNCLSEAAELIDSDRQAAMLTKSVECYEDALKLEEDSVTWTNLADTLIQLTLSLIAVNKRSDAEATFERAREAFQSATALSSSYEGDDLPGLLCNWGTGLTAVAVAIKDSGEPSSSAEILKDAIKRLQTHISLAEAQRSLAEALVLQCEAAVSEDAEAALQASLAACSRSLQIDCTHAGAMLTKAETHEMVAKLGARFNGNKANVQEHCENAVRCYEHATRNPEKLGAFTERCTTQYNYACALAKAGKVPTALQLLKSLAQVAPHIMTGLSQDEDLESMRSTPEFELLRKEVQLVGT